MENKTSKQPENALPHDIELKNKKLLKISGVKEVVMATSSNINLQTYGGPLNINGADLKIKNLNEVEKKIEIEGSIFELKYADKKKKFLNKVFK